jgi:ubiquinone/menaquinone biosynthesis C-methylase UbiE
MATPPPDHDQVREQQRQFWQSRVHAEQLELAAQQAPDPVSRRLIELAAIKKDAKVLDLACGVGNPSFLIAELVGAQGHVYGADLSVDMIAAATARASEQGITQVTFHLIQNERDLPAGPASVDAAVCQFGLMYMPDGVGALQAIGAALKPGGRLAVCTWGPIEHSPLQFFLYALANRHFAAPIPHSDQPGPMALSSRDALEALFETAGYTEIQSETYAYVGIHEATPEAFWNSVELYSGTAVRLFSTQPDAVRQAVSEEAIHLLTGMFPQGEIGLSGEVVFAAGTKPV